MAFVFAKLPVIVVPGWDCITGNHCSRAGKPGVNHGIHGDEFIYGIRTELADGRFAALTLNVFTGRYPSTVEDWRRRPIEPNYYPRGSSVDLHLQIPRGGSPPHEYGRLTDECQWLGEGRRCFSDGSCSIATDMYGAHGLKSDALDVDLTQQPDALYTAMAELLQRWTEDK